LKNDVNVPPKSNKQKNLLAWIRGSGSAPHCHGSQTLYKIINKCIIYLVPGAVLILTELHDVMQQIPELQVRVAAVPGKE
jgi:hypothetical protein